MYMLFRTKTHHEVLTIKLKTTKRRYTCHKYNLRKFVTATTRVTRIENHLVVEFAKLHLFPLQKFD